MTRFRISTLLWLTLIACLVVVWQRDHHQLKEHKRLLKERDAELAQFKKPAYPYYTTRGPRDFLMPNPPTIGNTPTSQTQAAE